MQKEVGIATGRRHLFVLSRNLVELRIEWPEQLVDRLPEDFTLRLWGPQLPKQERTKSAASRDDDLFQWEFTWEDKTKDVQLEVSGNGQTIVLWREQVAGNLDLPIDWDERLHPLLSEPEEVEVAGQPAVAGVVADDLRGEELRPVIARLA